MYQKLLRIVPFFSLIVLLLISQNGQAQSNENISKQFNYNVKSKRINPANIRSTIFSADFTGQVLPPGWTNVSNISGNHVWLFNNPGSRNISGPFDSDFALLDSYYYGPSASENATLTTSAIDASTLTTVTLGFLQQFRAMAPSYGVVQVSNDNVHWTLVDSITTHIGYPNPPVYSEYDLTAVAAGQPTVYIRWTYVGSYNNWWAIDNVIVYEPDLYPNPAINVSPADGETDIAVDASLNWTPDGGATPTGYRIYFGTDGGGITPPSNIENNTDLGLVTTYIPVSALSYNLTYYWMVIPYSNEGDATGNVIWSFTTGNSPISMFPYNQDFEDIFPPDGWSRFSGLLADPVSLISTSYGWKQDDWQNVSSPVNKAAGLNVSGTSANYWLMTPLIDLGTGTDYRLEFDLTLNAQGTPDPPAVEGTDDKFAVIISTDEGKTWTSANTLRLWDNEGSPDVYNDINYSGEHEIINITGYTGIVRFGFYGESSIINADNDLMIDNFYINVKPSGAPIFMINPSSLDFGAVEIGSSSSLQATVSNPGDDNLIISNITSLDDQFTFIPAAFPVTIAAGNDLVLDVTFTPVNPGNQVAALEIEHNAAGSPTLYSVRGVGVNAGPIFSVNTESLNFGNVDLGSSADLTVTVTNPGTINPLTISSAVITGNDFSVEPAVANIPAGGNQVFTITFTPQAEETYADSLIFTDNAPGSPHSVRVSGTGFIPPPASGLVFEQDTVYQLEDESYSKNIQLINLTSDVHAIQFKLLVNTETDDNMILTFQNIQKGNDISEANWVLDYSISRGPITANGASMDTVFVLLYNLNQVAVLPAGDYSDLMEVNYRVADLTALQDSLKSSIRIANAEASTFDGNPVDIAPSVDDLIVVAKNRVSSLGDVNGDGCLDILDLIMVVDHIVRKDSLKGEAFSRADIAPWPTGTSSPSPDGVINVQDLSLIQYIILTGIYPDGTILNGCSYASMQKISGDADATVTLYINNKGLTAYLDSKYDIRGAQIEFGNISNEPKNLVINTDLGEGYYMKVNDLLRTVLYDRFAVKYIEAGKHFLADMPFSVTHPEEITVKKIILADMNKYKIENIGIEIIYGNAPSLPLDYILFQNYPNPFNPHTSIKFQVPKSGEVSLKIYDMLGQEVRTLYSGQVQRGTHTLKWDGLNDLGIKLSSGTYIYRIKAGEFIQSKKMILLK